MVCKRLMLGGCVGFSSIVGIKEEVEGMVNREERKHIDRRRRRRRINLLVSKHEVKPGRGRSFLFNLQQTVRICSELFIQTVGFPPWIQNTPDTLPLRSASKGTLGGIVSEEQPQSPSHIILLVKCILFSTSRRRHQGGPNFHPSTFHPFFGSYKHD